MNNQLPGTSKKIMTKVATTPIIPLVHSVDAEIKTKKAPAPERYEITGELFKRW